MVICFVTLDLLKTLLKTARTHTHIYIYIQSFKVGRVGDDELFGKLRINVSQCLNAQAKLGRRPLRSSVAAGTSS